MNTQYRKPSKQQSNHNRSVTPLGRIVPFKDVQPGQAFKVLKPEFHQDYSGPAWHPPACLRHLNHKDRTKEIPNTGTYVKAGFSGYAHDVATGKDAIFHINAPCRLLPTKFNLSHLKADCELAASFGRKVA